MHTHDTRSVRVHRVSGIYISLHKHHRNPAHLAEEGYTNTIKTRQNNETPCIDCFWLEYEAGEVYLAGWDG